MASSRKNVSPNRNRPEIHHLRSMVPRTICVSREHLRATPRFGWLFRTVGVVEGASSGHAMGRATDTVRGYIADGGQPLAVVFFTLCPSYMWY